MKIKCQQQAGAWVTHALDKDEVVSALVLARSLRRVMTSRKVVAIVDPDLSPESRDALDQEFDFVFPLDQRVKSLQGLERASFGKLFAVSLQVFQRIAYLPPNSLFLKNYDEIFQFEKPVGILQAQHPDDPSNVFFFPPNLQHFVILREEWIGYDESNGFRFDPFFATWLLNQYPEGVQYINADIRQLCVKNYGIPEMGSDFKIIQFVNNCKQTSGRLLPLHEMLRSAELKDLFPVCIWRTIYEEDVKPLLRGAMLNRMINTSLSMPTFTNGNCSKKEAIAVVGMGCRHPASNNVDEFWKLLIEGGDAIRTPPDYRWTKDQCIFSRPDFQKTQAGFLNVPVDEFDAKFFGISPKEVVFMDPQHRLLHEVVWEALEDALIDPTLLRGSSGGVFLGTWRNDYVDILQRSSSMEFYRGYMGNSIGAGAARISHLLGLHGPCVATESGCSAAMVAVHMACRSLESGESNMALACGVNLLLHPFKNDIMPMVTSPEGRCKTFDTGADGFGRAEGCAVLVLKRLSDAIQDEDRIWGLIRGSAISQEGLSKSMGTPTVHCEAKAMRLALEDAGIHPSQVSYVETHGTGTVVGDPMEVAAIENVYSSGRKKEEPLIIGSVKTNVGHTESCSGITGIMKVLLSLKNEVIPAHKNFEEINPEIDLSSIPAVLPLTPVKWPRPAVSGNPRIAGVSSFGITGTDAHVIIEEAPKCKASPKLITATNNRPLHIMKISAKSEEALEVLLDRYKKLMETNQKEFADIAFSGNVGRASFNHRAVLIAGNNGEACLAIEKGSILRKECAAEDQPQICFLFTGQGSQYPNMAKSLYSESPIFAENFDTCDKLLKDMFGISIANILFTNGELQSDVNRTLFSQTGIFVVEYCLFKLWDSWGVKPNFVLGHSLGEFCAAVCAGVLSLKDAITLVAKRSLLIDALPHGKMLAVKADKREVDSHLKLFMKEIETQFPQACLDYAAINSDEQIVLAGDSNVVEKFAKYGKRKGLKVSLLASTHAFHSRHMDPILEEYRNSASKIKYAKPGYSYVSGMLGKLLDESSPAHINAEYWVDHARKPVNFMEASKTAYQEGCRVFIEIGPHPVLLPLIMLSNDGKSMVCVPSLKRNENDWKTILESVGKLFLNGIEINWRNFDKLYPRKKVSLPHYPFQGKKFWPEVSSIGGIQLHPLLGSFLSNPTPSKIFQSSLNLRVLEYLKDHMIGQTVVFPGAAFLEMILVAGHLAIEGCKEELTKPRRSVQLNNLRIESPLSLEEESSCACQVVVNCNEDDTSENVIPSDSWAGVKVKVYHQQNSRSEEGNISKWVPHATGYFLPRVSAPPLLEELLDIEEMKSKFSEENISTGFYDRLADIGLKFGPCFRTLETVWRGESELLAEVTVPEESQGYFLHPCLIDAIIQAIMVNTYFQKLDQTRTRKKLYVPIGIEKLFFFNHLPVETGKCYIYCNKGEGTSGSKAYGMLLSSSGLPIAYMTGLDFAETTVKSIQALLDQQVNLVPDLWEEVWKGGIGPLQCRLDIPHSTIQIPYEKYNHVEDEPKRRAEKVDKLVYYFILKTFSKLGWTPELGKVVILKEFLVQLGISKQHEGITRYFLTVLEEESILEYDKMIKNTWHVAMIPPNMEEITEYIKTVQENCSQNDFDIKLVSSVSNSLADILQGRESALNILFPKEAGSPSAEHFYESLLSEWGSNAEDYFKKVIHHNTKDNHNLSHIRNLEVGAGTGSFTRDVLQALESSRENNIQFEYFYTDLSPAFFNLAEKKFEDFGEVLKFKKLNLEEDPTSQGFSPGYFDFIYGFEVIHATRNVRETLANLRSLLREDGKLFIVETVRLVRRINFTFGLLEGYWRFNDRDLRPYDAILPVNLWEELLRESGFTNITSFHILDGAFAIIEGQAASQLPIYPVVRMLRFGFYF